MTAFEGDDRVRSDKRGGFFVRGDPHDRHVMWVEPFGWSIYEGLDMVLLGCGYRDADEAIRSLIGEPRKR